MGQNFITYIYYIYIIKYIWYCAVYQAYILTGYTNSKNKLFKQHIIGFRFMKVEKVLSILILFQISLKNYSDWYCILYANIRLDLHSMWLMFTWGREPQCQYFYNVFTSTELSYSEYIKINCAMSKFLSLETIMILKKNPKNINLFWGCRT